MKTWNPRTPVARIGTSWGGASMLVFWKILDLMPVTARHERLSAVL